MALLVPRGYRGVITGGDVGLERESPRSFQHPPYPPSKGDSCRAGPVKVTARGATRVSVRVNRGACAWGGWLCQGGYVVVHVQANVRKTLSTQQDGFVYR